MNPEQTVNAEAKIRLREIMAYADVPSVKNRGIITNVVSSPLVNSLRELVDSFHENGGNEELRESGTETDKTAIDQNKDLLELTLNPFQIKSNKNVFFVLRTGYRIKCR